MRVAELPDSGTGHSLREGGAVQHLRRGNFPLGAPRAELPHMEGMFWAAADFNGDLPRWDTGDVVDMAQMFHNAPALNSRTFRLGT